MYKMSVIIPCYNARETIRATLHSIAMQSIANEIEVIVANDADGLRYSDIICDFPELDIRIVHNEVNKGCAGARNLGIRAAMADYITFIDADDCFTNCLALEVMYNRIVAEQADVLVSVFESEGRFDDGIVIKSMKNAITWCHGKVYRRQYLLDNNIFFDERLRLNEDCLFHQILFDGGAKVVEIPMVTLMWRDNPKSVTHESAYKNKRTFVDAVTYYLEDCAKRGLTGEKVKLRVCQNISVIYNYMNLVLDDYPEKEDDFFEACRNYWKLAEPILSEVDDEFITRVFLAVNKKAETIPNLTFVQFLDKIRN